MKIVIKVGVMRMNADIDDANLEAMEWGGGGGVKF